MKIIKWIVVNVMLSASIYYGLYQEVDGAANIAYFLAWFTVAVSLLALSDEHIKELRKEGRAAPAWLDGVIDICITLSFVWAGAIGTGIFYAMACLLQHGAREKAARLGGNQS